MGEHFLMNIASEVKIITKAGTKHVTLDTLEEFIDPKKLLSVKNSQFETLISEVIRDSGKSDSENYYSSKFKELRRKLTSRKAGNKCQMRKSNEKEQENAEIEILQCLKLMLTAEKKTLHKEIVFYSNEIRGITEASEDHRDWGSHRQISNEILGVYDSPRRCSAYA